MEILTTIKRAPIYSDKVICMTLASNLGYKSVRFAFHEELEFYYNESFNRHFVALMSLQCHC